MWKRPGRWRSLWQSRNICSKMKTGVTLLQIVDKATSWEVGWFWEVAQEEIWPYTEKDNINSTNANLSHDPLHFVLEIKGQCNFINLQFGTLCEIKMQVIKLKTRLSDLGKCFLERTIPFQQMTSFAPFSWNCVFNIIWRCKLGIWEKDSWPQTHSSSQRTQTSIRMGEKKTQKRLLVYFRYLWRKGFYGPFSQKK